MPDMTPTDEPVIPTGDAVPGAARKGFLASPSARIIVIVGAAVGLLVVVGAVVGIVLLNLGKKALEQTAVNTLNATITATATPVSASSATGSVDTTTQGNKLSIPVTNKDVFVSRDPFEPTLKPLPAPAPATESTIPASERNVLTLQDIVTTNGVLKAILKWDGVQYTVGVNEQLGTSPWKVLAITKTTVTMLYGDVQVTLSVGEGVQRD